MSGDEPSTGDASDTNRGGRENGDAGSGPEQELAVDIPGDPPASMLDEETDGSVPSVTSYKTRGAIQRSDASGVLGYNGYTGAEGDTNAAGVTGVSLAPQGAGTIGAAIESDTDSFLGAYWPVGVLGETDHNSAESNLGAGVFGSATATTGVNVGVWGETDSPDGFGVYGSASTSGSNAGVYGYSSSERTDAVAVEGVSRASTGTTYGVEGETESMDSNAAGVRGIASNGTGSGFGVVGEAKSTYGASAAILADGRNGNTDGLRAWGGADGITATAGQSGATGVTGWNVTGDDSFDSRGIEGHSNSRSGIGVFGKNWANTGTTYGVYGEVESGDGYGMYSRGDIFVDGDVFASGSKPFVEEIETPEGTREIVYTAVEAGGVRTKHSGVATLDDGRAEVSLPDHFGYVTSATEPLIARATPHSGNSAGLAVVDRSTDRLVVEDLEGTGSYEFSYTVEGTREGYADRSVVREPRADPAAEADPSPPEPPAEPDLPDRSDDDRIEPGKLSGRRD